VTALAIAKPCVQCHQVYLGRPRQKLCPVCAEANKKASDGRCSARQRAHEHRDHLSPAEVERVYQAALAQIRRERRHEADVSTSQAWKYQEP
jgi:hypothetical protein